MTKIYITADTHWGHKNILNFNPDTRKYLDIDHMNSSMIKEWNNIVTPNDLVYHLGDVAFTNAEKATAIMNQLNGRKILIKGNHDDKLVQDAKFVACFEEIHSYLEIRHNDILVCMFHFPIMDWRNAGRGSVHLHGHCHSNPTGLEQYRIRDVGMDATGKVVSLLDDVVKDALTGEIKAYHH